MLSRTIFAVAVIEFVVEVVGWGVMMRMGKWDVGCDDGWWGLGLTSCTNQPEQGF